MKYFLSICSLLMATALSAQYWQQKVDYRMEIDFDVTNHQFEGKQLLVYVNNSPDTLDRIFYHLYFNAFQPGSMMDVRSRSIVDPSQKIGSRIASLGEDEIGYLRVQRLVQDGNDVAFKEVGTILEVDLAQAIPPGGSTIMEMNFLGQVPVQIRRSGRDNAEGISYSMSQWYPKLCEYDYQGWHANPYIGREFHGVWGNFDVKLTIDQSYLVGATGILQNPDQIGHGYGAETVQHEAGTSLTWHFRANNVHDFVWAADPDYSHTQLETDDGVTLHFIFQENEKTEENWSKLPGIMKAAWPYINARFGKYPYEAYSFIQGGDGGMEYPMATLITGERSLGSLVGVSVHELMHSWYQMILGTNESLYPWMDEGFTSYASTAVMNELKRMGELKGEALSNPYSGTYRSYRRLASSGLEEPMNTHSDHYNTNYAYGQAAYTKGSVFLRQLEYVVGKPAFDKALLKYYDTWKFKHPNANDFIRVFEDVTGLELDWYKEYFVNSTKTIDYRLDSIVGAEEVSHVLMSREGLMPMPMDVEVELMDGSRTIYTIPLRIMRGAKKSDHYGEVKVAESWPWTHQQYALEVPFPKSMIKAVRLDPSQRMADVKQKGNFWTLARP
ncbi:MAG: M1 family metallopeptidase [Saprospiraceae bacterium]|nr:M1 family metallopeptidase [Saprospiraceae bacterium]